MASTQTSGETQCQGAGGTGTKYTYAQLEGLWINAGGAKSQAPLMAAIAMAESGGCSTAYNPSGASGLWQILGAPTGWTGSTNWYDPATNALAAVAKYKTQGLDAWETYTNGSYKAYLSDSVQPDTSSIPPSTQQTASTSTCLTGEAFGFCPLSNSEARALVGGALMIAGGLLVLPGLLMLAAFGFRGAGGAAARSAQVLERTPGYGHVIRHARTRSENRAARGRGARTEQLRRERAAGRKAERARGAQRRSAGRT